MKFLAAEETLGDPVTGVGTIGEPGNGVDSLAKILSTVIGVLTVVAAIFFMFNLITGAISIITAGGDKAQVEDARRKMTNGFIGVVCVVAAMFIMDIVAKFLGIPNILDLEAMVTLVTTGGMKGGGPKVMP